MVPSGSFSNSFTSSLGENTEFSGSVGSIPDIRLTDEQFGWRMFVCKREIAPGLKVDVVRDLVGDRYRYYAMIAVLAQLAVVGYAVPGRPDHHRQLSHAL